MKHVCIFANHFDEQIFEKNLIKMSRIEGFHRYILEKSGVAAKFSMGNTALLGNSNPVNLNSLNI